MKVLVTGGGGFLGTYICEELIAQGHKVFNFSRHHYPHLDQLGVKTFIGNLSEISDLESALNSIEAVIHTAAIAGVWGKKDQFYQTNTIGTQNLVDACKKNGVKYFIYTSTPSVVFGKDDIEHGDETLPYPNKFYTDYASTKALAEKYVLESCDENFKAVAIRPHLIWGPRDPHIIPRLIEKAKAGKLKIVGTGSNLVDVIYVKNAAIAHIQALNTLTHDSHISGNAYFIGQERPVNLWDFINQLLHMANVEQVEDKVSFSVAYYLGFMMEIIFKIAGIYKPEPPMTRFVSMQLAKHHYFSHQKALKDFGYQPKFTIEQGLQETFKDRFERDQLVKNVSSIDALKSFNSEL